MLRLTQRDSASHEQVLQNNSLTQDFLLLTPPPTHRCSRGSRHLSQGAVIGFGFQRCRGLAHVRHFIPKVLTKKLESIVRKPNAVSLAIHLPDAA